MNAVEFLEAVCALDFENTFNPYSERCAVCDLDDAPRRRAHALQAMLDAATMVEMDSIWIGRDLGYRGGRRTGLALTDDIHLSMHTKRWGVTVERPTKGEALGERTAAVVWSVLSRVEASVFLWNVFPLHPHEAGHPFSNRSHNARERKAGEELLSELIRLLKPHQLVAIGNDAAKTVRCLAGHRRFAEVRHPSYGGQIQFRQQVAQLYNLPFKPTRSVFSYSKSAES